MAKATTDGATITTSNNNNEQRALSIMCLCWKQPQQKLYCLYVCVCLCMWVCVCVCVCLRTTDTIRAQLSALMSEAMEPAVMYAPRLQPFPLSPQLPLTRLPSCRCAFLRQKTAARNHNDKNHASQHRPMRTHTIHTQTDIDTMCMTKMRIIFVWWLSESLQLNKK